MKANCLPAALTDDQLIDALELRDVDALHRRGAGADGERVLLGDVDLRRRAGAGGERAGSESKDGGARCSHAAPKSNVRAVRKCTGLRVLDERVATGRLRSCALP